MNIEKINEVINNNLNYISLLIILLLTIVLCYSYGTIKQLERINNNLLIISEQDTKTIDKLLSKLEKGE